MSNTAIVLDPENGESLSSIDGEVDTLSNNILLSLKTQKGSVFDRPDFGSELHKLERSKATESTLQQVEQYCKESLAWLLELGRLVSVEVNAELDSNRKNRINFELIATAPKGRELSFDLYIGVE